MRALGFIGAEKQILNDCSLRERKGYQFFNGVQFFLVMLVAWEIHYLVGIVFGKTWWSILAGVFWAFVFFNLYRVILFTVSGERGNTFREKSQIVLLNAFKISIVVFFALMISIPLRLFLYEDYINQKIPEVVEEKILEVAQSVDIIYEEREQVIHDRLQYYEGQLLSLRKSIGEQKQKRKQEIRQDVKEVIATNIEKLERQYQRKEQFFKPVIQEYNYRLIALQKEKAIEMTSYIEMIESSNLLSERFSLLVRHKPISGFLFTLFIVAVFLSPLGFRLYSVYSESSEYDLIRDQRVRNEIFANQLNFKKSYHRIIQNLLNVNPES
ncbi:DUF4407 domain-containing protein [bacterium SCSIO 12643]|nr:DUF4407 domain-containing protein [bacterium SCSIO 12643]